VKLIRKDFGNLKTNFRSKFVKCDASSLKRGDYLHIVFVLKNQKRKRGLNLRLNKQTGILVRKLVKHHSMSIILSIMFKFEKVKFYLNIDSPQIITVKYINKRLKNKYILKSLLNKNSK
jgi:hypothetical protein